MRKCKTSCHALAGSMVWGKHLKQQCVSYHGHADNTACLWDTAGAVFAISWLVCFEERGLKGTRHAERNANLCEQVKS